MGFIGIEGEIKLKLSDFEPKNIAEHVVKGAMKQIAETLIESSPQMKVSKAGKYGTKRY